MDRLGFEDNGREKSNEAELRKVPRQDDSHSVLSDFLGALGLPDRQSENIRNEEKTTNRSAFEDASSPETLETEQTKSAPHDVCDDHKDENGAAPEPVLSMPDSPPESPPVHRKKISKSSIAAVLFIASALLLAALRYAWPTIVEPSPPNPDVAAVYGGKYILIDDLKKFMDVEGIREREHAYCKIHGFDHSKCDPSEPCEVHPIDTLEGYRALLTRYAAEQAILQWADRKNVTARESVRHSIKDIMGDASVMNTLSQLHLKELSPESISKWEVQQYYDANPTSYGDKEFSAVEDEIRNILAEKKHEDFLPGYIEGLKKSAGLEVNFDLLRVTEPSENDIRAFYEENIAGYQTPERAEITEIVFDSRETADKAVRMLGSGASFETVGAEYGRDGAPQARIIEGGSGLSEMNAAIWRMAEGETSGVLADTDGSIRMVRLIRKMPPGVRPLTDVRAEITEAISLENMEREYSLRKDEAVFSIHSERYTLGDFYTEFKELSPEYQRALSAFDMKKELLEQFIAKELLLEESDDASKSESELHDMDELRVQYLSQILHKEEVDDKLSEPTDDEARLFYENNKRFFITEPEALISLIAIDAGRNGEKFEQARKKVGEAKEMLDSGVDFAEVAKKYSEDPRAKNGGEISQWLCRNDLSPELWRAIFALKPGEYSGIIETGGGFLIIKLRELTEQKQRTFEESAALIKTMLKSQRHKEMEEDMEKQLLEERGFTIYDKTLRRLLKEQAATL